MNSTVTAVVGVPMANCHAVGTPPDPQGGYEVDIEKTGFNLSICMFIINGMNSPAWVNEKMFSILSFVDVAAFVLLVYFVANVIVLGNYHNQNWTNGEW